MFLPSAETRISTGSCQFLLKTENLRFSLGLRYAGLNTFDFRSTETSGSTLMFGTGDTLRPNGTLDIRDGGAYGRLSLASLGSHG